MSALVPRDPRQNQDHQRKDHQKSGLDREDDPPAPWRAEESGGDASRETTEQGQSEYEGGDAAPDRARSDPFGFRPAWDQENHGALEAQQQTEDADEDDSNGSVFVDRRSGLGHLGVDSMVRCGPCGGEGLTVSDLRGARDGRFALEWTSGRQRR